MHPLLSQGIELMLFGMGSVAVFLTLLVAVTIAMSSLLTRYFPEVSTPPAPATAELDPKLVQAIQLAVAEHRRR